MLKISHSDVSYLRHVKELEILLKKLAVGHHRQPIVANAYQQENKPGQEGNPKTAIGQVVIYIEEHLTEQLSLEKMAEEARLSKYQLIRGFRKEKGTTPWKFLITKRVDKAKELLKNGMSPGQTAVETGFYDQPHFSKSFREVTGFTPKEYQEKNFRNKN